MLSFKPSYEVFLEIAFRQQKLLLKHCLRSRRQGAYTGYPQASDPRDCVFALFNLSAEEDGVERPSVDYQKSTEEVFALAAKYCFESEGSLDVLGLCEPRCDSTSGLPRWTPDFSRPRRDQVPLHNNCLWRTPFDASSRRRFKPDRQDPWDVLTARGKTVQTIAWIDDSSGFWDEDANHRDRSSKDRLGLEQLSTILPTSVERSRTTRLDAMRILRLISHSLQLELLPDSAQSSRDQGIYDTTSLETDNLKPASSRVRIPDNQVAALYRGIPTPTCPRIPGSSKRG
jgi:hypothetical protein